MKTKITIAFSCPKKTVELINDYASRHGISRSACITMMCNAFLIADARSSYASSDSISTWVEEQIDGN